MNRPGIWKDPGLFFCAYPIRMPKNAARSMVWGMENFRLNRQYPVIREMMTRFQHMEECSQNTDCPMVMAIAMSMPRHMGRIPFNSVLRVISFWNLWIKWAAMRHKVREGIMVPRVAQSAPGIPPLRSPTKVAQLIPREPGVISAIATMSSTSSVVIHPNLSTSSLMMGIMVMPPKLRKPIFMKDKNRLR